MTSPPAPRSIVCFGDSLTVGYQSPPPGVLSVTETPYGGFLQDRLGDRARVIVTGICGELTGEMVARFEKDVLARRPDYVVILGGTNDLGWNVPIPEITRNLFLMYQRAHEAGIQPVALTVPSLRATSGADAEAAAWLRDHIARRRTVNAALEEYCSTHSLPCVDLFTATSEPGTGLLAARYSNDGLHFNTDGYHLIAELLYAQVFAALMVS